MVLAPTHKPRSFSPGFLTRSPLHFMIPLRFMGVSSLRRAAERWRSSGRLIGATQRWVSQTHSDGLSGETYPGSDVSEESGRDRLWTRDASLLCDATKRRVTA